MLESDLGVGSRMDNKQRPSDVSLAIREMGQERILGAQSFLKSNKSAVGRER